MGTSESKVPTQTFLLPGQQFCIGVPWERADLPKHGLPPLPPPSLPQANPLDKSDLAADPCAGWEIGACQVIRRLSQSSAKSLLAVRSDPREGTALVVLRQLDVSENGLQDLFEHAHWASHFRHQNLARAYGVEASEEGLFWVTEFASGATLNEISAACRKIGKAVPVGLALSTAYEAALALTELHVPGAHAHGFVSDESVFVSFDGHSKLLELGLFRCIDGKILRPEGLQAMAPYLAPEQVNNGRMPDPKTDVYALAAVLHECLSGHKLQNGFERHPHFAPPSTFNVALRGELDFVFARALDKDRSARFRSAADFGQALRSAGSAFMWKPAQRAEFVSQLFQTRKRREQVLMAGCEEVLLLPRPPKKAPSVPLIPIALPKTETRSMRPPEPVVPVARPAGKAKPKRRSKVRPLMLALVASALGWIWQDATVDRLLAPPRFIAPPVLIAMRPAPAPVAEFVPVEDSTELTEEAAERTLESARTVYAARSKVKPRKKRDDAPLPPWLAKGRRR